MAQEGVVQVAPDSTGKRIRNVQALVPQPDGTLQQVFMQVVGIVDEDGNPARFSDDHDLQQQLLDETRAIRLGIQLLVDWMNPEASVVRPLPRPATSKINRQPSAEENELIEMARSLRDDEDV